MREYSVPARYELPPRGNLIDVIADNAAEMPDFKPLARADGPGWSYITSLEFFMDVTAVAKGLIAAGIGSGDRVVLMSRTRYEWTLIDYAIWMVGAVTVPIYETSSAEQIRWIVSDSGAVAAIVEHSGHAELIAKVHDELPDLKHQWEIDGGAVAALTETGRGVADEEIAERRSRLGPESIATIIYTSGTTGRPKGVVLTHANLMTELGSAVALLTVFNEGGSTLLFLPLAHVLARIITVAPHMGHITVGMAPDPATLPADMLSFRPTFLCVAPRVLEKVYNSARQKADDGGRVRIFDAAADCAVAFSEAKNAGRRPSLGLRLRHALFDRLVYTKMRAALGGRCIGVITGSAPLGPRLGHFFDGAGVPITEGYGLTESTGGVTVGTPDHHKIGAVGRPMPGASVAIADDGEVLLKAPWVFPRYWNNEEATAEALRDGWFHTGDLGALDDDGFLSITGRKKDIIVTAGGKNVAPGMIEDRVRLHPIISQIIVVGDRRPFVAALVSIDEEYLPLWKAKHGKPGDAGVADLRDDPDLIAEVQAAVDDGNATVSHAEAVKKFRILPVDLTEAGGHLTASFKLKRDVVLRDFADEVERLYAS